MITLRQIQFALAVERHQHFKRAAQECNISQSALSLGIAELEKNLGVIIFERNNKKVIVTPIGKELLNRARKIYLDVKQLVEQAHAGQSELSFAMDLGFIPTIAPYLLPCALPIIRDQYPSFKLNIHEDLTEALLTAVRNGSIDAAVIALPYPTDNLDVFEFVQEKFYVVANKQHPLSKESKIKPNKLKTNDLLLLGEGHCLKEQIVDICQLEESLGTQVFKEASLNTLFQLAVNNMGITLVPAIALPAINHYEQIRTIPLDLPKPHRRLAIVTRSNYPRSDELKILTKLFTKALGSLAGVETLE